jgi:hypothetical protein
MDPDCRKCNGTQLSAARRTCSRHVLCQQDDSAIPDEHAPLVPGQRFLVERGDDRVGDGQLFVVSSSSCLQRETAEAARRYAEVSGYTPSIRVAA